MRTLLKSQGSHNFFFLLKVIYLLPCSFADAGDFTLQFDNVGSLRAFLAVDYVKRNLLTFIESFEALALNCAEVNENVFTLVCGDESVPFALVKPLYGPLQKSLLKI